MSILVRIVGGIVGRGAKTVAPINRNMSTGSVKVIPSKKAGQYGVDDLNYYNPRPKANAPIRAKSSDAIKIKSGK